MNIQIIWLASTFRLHGYLSLGGGSPAAGGHSGRGDHYRVRACLFLIIMIIVMIRLGIYDYYDDHYDYNYDHYDHHYDQAWDDSARKSS